MALDEEVPLPFLDREAPFCMKVSKVGCHKEVLVGLWGHTSLKWVLECRFCFFSNDVEMYHTSTIL